MLHRVVRRVIVYMLATKTNVYVTVKPLIDIHLLVHDVNENPYGRVAGDRICANILMDVLPETKYVHNPCGPVSKSSCKKRYLGLRPLKLVQVRSQLYVFSPHLRTPSNPWCF